MNPFFEKTLVQDSEIEWQQIEPKIRRKVMSFSKEIMLVKVAFEEGGIGT